MDTLLINQSNEQNTMIQQDKNKASNEGMGSVANKVPDITGLYKTERPLVSGEYLGISQESAQKIFDHTWEGGWNPKYQPYA